MSERICVVHIGTHKTGTTSQPNFLAGNWHELLSKGVLYVTAGFYEGLAEGLVLGMRAGLDPTALVAALSGGSVQSWVVSNRSQRMIDNEYPLGFKVSLHRKDLGIALAMASELGLDLPSARLASNREDQLIDQGFGDEDMSALARLVREPVEKR